MVDLYRQLRSVQLGNPKTYSSWADEDTNRFIKNAAAASFRRCERRLLSTMNAKQGVKRPRTGSRS